METKVQDQVEDHILQITYLEQEQTNLYSDAQLLLVMLQQMLMMF